MNRLEILHITSDSQFKNIDTDSDLIRAWGYYIYRTGEEITKVDFKAAVDSAKIVISKS